MYVTLLQVVTVEPGGLSRDHDDKIRLLIVSHAPTAAAFKMYKGLVKHACIAQSKCRTCFTVTLFTVFLQD